jgi:hypothetical protein
MEIHPTYSEITGSKMSRGGQGNGTTCNPSAQEVKAGGWKVHSQSGLHSGANVKNKILDHLKD